MSETPAPPVPYEPIFVPVLPRRFRDRVWLHAVLFALALATTTFVGVGHYAAFLSDFGRRMVDLEPRLLLDGLWYSLTIVAILGAHEMGHYLACRYYHVDASLPYFLPFPFGPTGTLGAVIRIRERFPTRRILFDIGVMGPLAGFAVLVPALFLGQLPGEVPQSRKKLLDIRRAQVILLNHFAKLLQVVHARLVEGRQIGRLLEHGSF